MTDRLFVYGTLGPGRPNEHVLTAIGGTWESGSIAGTLREAGWGAAMGYPGIDLGEGGARVAGFVFSSARLADHWAALDDFEGDAYQRVVTTVVLDDGREVKAYVYALRQG